MSKEIKLNVIQADIIFKALYYTARNEGVEIPTELTETYEVLAEENPKETEAFHTVEVMEYLNDLIRDSDEYSSYFLKDDEDDDTDS